MVFINSEKKLQSNTSKIPLKIRAFVSADEPAVIDLWQQCHLIYPGNNPLKDIHRKSRVHPHLFLVGIVEQKLVATVMAGYEGHRGWINYLAVEPEYQQRGIGQAIMLEAERLLQEVGCPKINLQVRSKNDESIKFYRNLGYDIDEVISLGKRLESDN